MRRDYTFRLISLLWLLMQANCFNNKLPLRRRASAREIRDLVFRSPLLLGGDVNIDWQKKKRKKRKQGRSAFTRKEMGGRLFSYTYLQFQFLWTKLRACFVTRNPGKGKPAEVGSTMPLGRFVIFGLWKLLRWWNCFLIPLHSQWKLGKVIFKNGGIITWFHFHRS